MIEFTECKCGICRNKSAAERIAKLEDQVKEITNLFLNFNSKKTPDLGVKKKINVNISKQKR